MLVFAAKDVKCALNAVDVEGEGCHQFPNRYFLSDLRVSAMALFKNRILT